MTSATRRTSAALATAVVLGMWTVYAQQAPGRWDTEKYAKLPQPAEEYTPVQVNDKLYLIGGNAAVLTPGARATHPARVMVYDLAANTWLQKKTHAVLHRPHERRHLQREDLYLRRLRRDDAGGAERHARHRVGIRPGRGQLEGAREADRRSGPQARRSKSAARSISSAARRTSPDPTAATRTPASSSARTKPTTRQPTAGRRSKPMPTPRNHPAIGVVAGKIYLIGGRITANNIGGFVAANVDVVEEYNPATDSWRAMNRMPTRAQRPGMDDVSEQDLRGRRRAARLPHRRRAARR